MSGEPPLLPPPPASPLERLQASRERMRAYLLPPSRRPRTEAEPAGMVERLGDKLGEWRDHPLVGAVIDAVEGWWAHHPMRSVADIGSTAARELGLPVVRRHPVASVAGALLVGALLVKVKPWRWVIKPALFAGLTSHVVSRLLSDAPMEFVLQALSKLRPHDKSAPQPSADASPPASVEPTTTPQAPRMPEDLEPAAQGRTRQSTAQQPEEPVTPP